MTNSNLIAAKYILRYPKGIVDYGLKYEANHNINLEGYVDSYWVVPLIRRPLQGATLVWDHVLSLGLAGRSPTWN